MELAENCLAHFLFYLISHGVQAKAKRRSHKLWSHALIPTVNTDSALFFQASLPGCVLQNGQGDRWLP